MEGNKCILNGLSKPLFLATYGISKDLKFIHLREAVNFAHHSSCITASHVSRMKCSVSYMQLQPPSPSPTNHSTLRLASARAPGSNGSKLFLQPGSDFVLSVASPSNL